MITRETARARDKAAAIKEAANLLETFARGQEEFTYDSGEKEVSEALGMFQQFFVSLINYIG